MVISKRINSIKESITLATEAKAKQLAREGRDIIGFGAGEPDFDTPTHIKEAAKKAIEEGFTKYTPASGMKELKSAICKKLREENNLFYRENQVIVSCGAKHAIFNAIMTLCEEGDEVILPSPFWVSYPEMIRASGAKIVIIETDHKNDFKVTSEQLERAITPRTKLFILNYPSNPTGTVYLKEELEELAKVILKHRIFCLSDEIYEKILYDNTDFVSIASLNEEMKDLTILVNGVSKAYSMTGWRIGYACADEKIIQAMSSFQSHSTSNPTSISQKAALAALTGPQDCVSKMVEEFAKRRNYIVDKLNSIKGVSCFKPKGAFYVFPCIKELLGKKYKGKLIESSLQFSEVLLEEANVAVVAGIAFGNDDYIRLSYATSLRNIEKGIDRIKDFVEKLN
ncbi:MAG: pyridoxal phosphate-dependent aminotransferase [Candidatus Omnitrophica bacterium]|nr:pyridoxal phosphate-dependent aminotransferase [Candidatus Omnitrophota bacterium]MCM8826521.1 pyridoxal phosphate-dependent aminotransferase [Candidatus Omnitrophota bacterium]